MSCHAPSNSLAPAVAASFALAGPGPPSAAMDGTPPPKGLDVERMLARINKQRALSAAETRAGAGVAASPDSRPAFIPSGPRRQGQGCEDAEQAIMLAEANGSGGARLRITLLAAGFIIGPSGLSVRDLSRLCGADIKSRTIKADARCARDSREFQVTGGSAAVVQTLGVMYDAVQRYKQLCEGQYAGQCVPRTQHVAGVDFVYQPPPRHIVPLAATLKSHSSLKRQASADRPASWKPDNRVHTHAHPPRSALAGGGLRPGRTFKETLSKALPSPRPTPRTPLPTAPPLSAASAAAGGLPGQEHFHSMFFGDAGQSAAAGAAAQLNMAASLARLSVQAHHAQRTASAPAPLTPAADYSLLPHSNGLPAFRPSFSLPEGLDALAAANFDAGILAGGSAVASGMLGYGGALGGGGHRHNYTAAQHHAHNEDQQQQHLLHLHAALINLAALQDASATATAGTPVEGSPFEAVTRPFEAGTRANSGAFFDSIPLDTLHGLRSAASSSCESALSGMAPFLQGDLSTFGSLFDGPLHPVQETGHAGHPLRACSGVSCPRPDLPLLGTWEGHSSPSQWSTDTVTHQAVPGTAPSPATATDNQYLGGGHSRQRTNTLSGAASAGTSLFAGAESEYLGV